MRRMVSIGAIFALFFLEYFFHFSLDFIEHPKDVIFLHILHSYQIPKSKYLFIQNFLFFMNLVNFIFQALKLCFFFL